MNQETFAGHWTEWKGAAREQFGKLTNDDLEQVQGRLEQFLGRIETRYGIAREEAEKEVDRWARSMAS